VWDLGKLVEFSSILHKNMTGTIKTLTEKGFGFIAREGETKDLFFHSNDLSGVSFNELKVGDTVNFEVVDGQKGPSAKNVTRV
jgi:CspA family cold shock protein